MQFPERIDLPVYVNTQNKMGYEKLCQKIVSEVVSILLGGNFDIEEMCSYMCGLLEMISIRRMTRRAKYFVEFMFYSSQVLWKTVRT